MSFLTIFFIAISLSFDTFAAAAASGILLKDISFTNAMKISFSFALFEGLMPIIGWFLGFEARHYIEPFSSWIAFVLLFIIGSKMIIESLKHNSDKNQLNPLKIKVMISMSIATSIDALVIGISFAVISINIIYAVLIIGPVSFISSMLGVLFGKKVGKHLGKEMDIIGGIILIAIGLKILIEHLSH